ncbi:MAG: hypothetical protein M3306_06240 [Actinomycetota bacterium]|nr:hypothetical protein [Actinomycetota bacterium]
MTTAVLVIVVLSGLSEAAGRVLPLVARRGHVSKPAIAGLLATGTVVESGVIALWPVVTWALAHLLPEAPQESAGVLTWTPASVAPLLLAGVLAFPLLGPGLHLLLLTGVGAGLTGSLSAATGSDLWLSAVCVIGAGVGLAASVESVRRAVSRVGTRAARR